MNQQIKFYQKMELGKMRNIFKRDFENVLIILEKLCRGDCDHVDFTRTCKYFIDTWAPKQENKKNQRNKSE